MLRLLPLMFNIMTRILISSSKTGDKKVGQRSMTMDHHGNQKLFAKFNLLQEVI